MFGRADITVELAKDYNDIFTQGNSGTKTRLCMSLSCNSLLSLQVLVLTEKQNLSQRKDRVIKIHYFLYVLRNTRKNLKMLLLKRVIDITLYLTLLYLFLQPIKGINQ